MSKTGWLAVGLTLALLTPGQAQHEPLVKLSPAGLHYEVESASVDGGLTWLAGSVGSTEDSGRAGPDDAFLTLLDPNGEVLWSKSFGSAEGVETVRCVFPLHGKGAYFAGHISADIEDAWRKEARPDYSKQAFLARIDTKGQLLSSLELSAEPGLQPLTSEGEEAGMVIRCLALTPQGELLAGGRFTGRFGNLTSRNDGSASQALLLRFDPNLKLLDARALPGLSLDLLEARSGEIIGAGIAESEQGDNPMAPPKRRSVAWNLSGQPEQLWRGELRENTKCLQLDHGFLVLSDNEVPGSYRVDLKNAALEELPAGVRATALWSNVPGPTALLATGYRTGKTGDDISEVGGAILWQKTEGWRPLLRWGSSRRDFVPFLFASGDEITLVGVTEGDLPAQSKSREGDQRWVWARISGLPQPGQSASLGVRDASLTRQELAQNLQDLKFVERPGYDHFVGFVRRQGEVEGALVTEEQPGFDRWSLLDLKDAEALASWGPSKPKERPMEPQIFPHVSGSVVVCRDFENSGPARIHWSRLPSGRALEATLPSEQPAECQSVVALDGGASVALVREFDGQGAGRLTLLGVSGKGELAWSNPLGDFLEDRSWVAACRAGDQVIALREEGSELFVDAYSMDGEAQWGIPLDVRRGEAVGWINGEICVVSCTSEGGDDLRLDAISPDGARLWTSEVPLIGPVAVSKILEVDGKLTMVGGLQDTGEEQWRGFVASFDRRRGEWLPRSMKVGHSNGFNDAVLIDDHLWVGGEITRDHETDAFWGRFRP